MVCVKHVKLINLVRELTTNQVIVSQSQEEPLHSPNFTIKCFVFTIRFNYDVMNIAFPTFKKTSSLNTWHMRKYRTSVNQ